MSKLNRIQAMFRRFTSKMSSLVSWAYKTKNIALFIFGMFFVAPFFVYSFYVWNRLPSPELIQDLFYLRYMCELPLICKREPETVLSRTMSKIPENEIHLLEDFFNEVREIELKSYLLGWCMKKESRKEDKTYHIGNSLVFSSTGVMLKIDNNYKNRDLFNLHRWLNDKSQSADLNMVKKLSQCQLMFHSNWTYSELNKSLDSIKSHPVVNNKVRIEEKLNLILSQMLSPVGFDWNRIKPLLLTDKMNLEDKKEFNFDNDCKRLMAGVVIPAERNICSGNEN